MAKFTSAIVGLLFAVVLAASVVADEAQKKAILVTGASSGIGLRITEVLAANGYVVYAGARKEEDLKRLEAMENVEAVRLDVTVQSDIDAAAKLIKDKGRGLYGLVNNAGIVSMGPLIEVPVSELESVFDVNVYGPYRVTQALAPFIIDSKGRIVNISSITGIFSGGLSGQYSMSKHAVEAFTESLAIELKRFGVKVSAIEPGSFASNAGTTAAKRLEKNAVWNENTRYKDELNIIKGTTSGDDANANADASANADANANANANANASADASAAPDPVLVANAVMDALFSETPKRRYLVVADAMTASVTIHKAMQEVVELNQNQVYTLGREQLIKILDHQLKKLD